jgi:opacity protein-like surface antigen
LLKLTVAAALMMLSCAVLAHAQGGFDAYFGLGTAHAGSTNQPVDLLGTGNLVPTSSMGGVFGTLGAGLMLNSNFGIGGEVSFRFAQQDYAGAGLRPVFYDFNGIWLPLGQKRVVPEIQAGLGGASLRFYGGSVYCNPYTGQCSNYAGSINHLQLHAGLGVRFFLSEHIFIRPQFDYHWVRHLAEFKSDSVPAYSIAIGFSSR